MMLEKGTCRGAVVGLIVLGLLAGGCGSDGETTTSEPEAVTKAEFIGQADAICLATNTEIDAIAEGVEPAETAEEASAVVLDLVNQSIPVWQSELDDLGALTPPEEDRNILTSYFDAFVVALSELEAAVAAVEADGPAADTGLSLSASVFEEANGHAQDYGMIVCGAAA